MTAEGVPASRSARALPPPPDTTDPNLFKLTVLKDLSALFDQVKYLRVEARFLELKEAEQKGTQLKHLVGSHTFNANQLNKKCKNNTEQMIKSNSSTE